MSHSPSSAHRVHRHPHPRPTTALDPIFTRPLLELHAALTIDSLWSASVSLLDTALPVHDLIAALPYEGLAPMTFRTTVQADDMLAYRQRLESAEPPLAQVIAQSPGLLCSFLDDHLSEPELFASPFYQKVMAPDGVRYVGALLFWAADGRFIAQIGMNRTAQQGPFTAAERQLLLQLHPHLSVAIQRVNQYSSQQAVSQMLQQALDHPMEGLVLMNSRELIVFHNNAAIEACAWWRGGRSAAMLKTKKTSTFQLPPAIQSIASQMLQHFRSQFNPQPSTQTLPPSSTESNCIHPSIPGLQANLRIIAPPNAAVPPHIRIRISRIAKSDKSLPVHLLSHAEYRTAQLAADGLRNEDIAHHLGISINTVRAHLRAVFDKLGVHHRGELVSHFN